MPDRVPERMSEYMPERYIRIDADRMSEHLPERMSDTMSEYMYINMYIVNRRFSPICMFLVDIEVICSHSRRQEIHSFGMTVVFSEDLQ